MMDKNIFCINPEGLISKRRKSMPEYATRIKTMEKTAKIIENLFKAMTDSEIISFGGGSPAVEALPVEIIRKITGEVMKREEQGILALQYGAPKGTADLRQVVVDYQMKPKGIHVTADNVLITSGGLETMNLVCQLYINPGDVILVESPTFVHGVEIFEMFEAKCIACPCDDQGYIMDLLEEKIKEFHPKMIYVIPTFQNPTGKTLPEDRRRKLAELGSQYNVIILEDDPYRDIRYSGSDLLPVKAYDKTGHTILANSFSKIFSPGSRLGYVVASEEIIGYILHAKTATNSFTNTISQVICAEFFKRGYYPEHHKMICDLYRERRDTMLQCLRQYFPTETKFTQPDGGLFVWVELPEYINTTELLKEAVARKVAYVAGEGFYVEGNGKGRNCMRISFSAVAPDKIRIGMERLGKLVYEKLK